MTQPADPLDPPPGVTEEQLLAALTAALVAGAAVSVFGRLLSRFSGVGSFGGRVIEVMGWQPLLAATANEIAVLPRDSAPVTRVLHGVVTLNAIRRAAYLVSAARRLAPAIASRDRGRIEMAKTVEERHRQAHERAERLRSEAGYRIVDEIADRGTDRNGEILLGWYAILDSRTSVDCRWADGRNFNALVPPIIGYPGTAHLECRCRPGRPHETRKRVERGKIPAHD